MSDPNALQEALADEHAVIYGYGVAGPRLQGADRAAADAGFDAHRLRRERLAELVTAAGQTPVAPAAAYELPFPVQSAADARRLIALLEAGISDRYYDLVLTAATGERVEPVDWLSDSAAQRARFDGGIAAFPGAPRPVLP